MGQNNTYKCLKNNIFSNGKYSLIPIRYQDRMSIMQWRNEQIYHLRQVKPLTETDQNNYFNNVVTKLFEQEQPDQILFSYLENSKCIGYGGLVHINWIDKNAEISFIIDTRLEKDFFHKHWGIYLDLIEQVAFAELDLHKIYTYAFDLRPHLYKALEEKKYQKEAILKEHCYFNGEFKDVIIHSKISTKCQYQFKDFILLSEEEIQMVFNWRNHIEIRKWMYNQDIIPIEKHIQFVKGLKDNLAKQYWLVQRKNTNIGVMSVVDKKENTGEWGYYIAPEFHERNLGVEFYYFSLKYLFDILGFESIYGFALVKNIAANSLNDLFGFDKELVKREINGISYDFYYRNLTKKRFLNKITNDSKILKLLDFTLSKDI